MTGELNAKSYEALVASAHDQLRLKITDKKIQSITYLHDKRRWHVEVGQSHPEYRRYTVVAIFESTSYIVMTQGPTGQPGLTVMVNSAEITDITEVSS